MSFHASTTMPCARCVIPGVDMCCKHHLCSAKATYYDGLLKTVRFCTLWISIGKALHALYNNSYAKLARLPSAFPCFGQQVILSVYVQPSILAKAHQYQHRAQKAVLQQAHQHRCMMESYVANSQSCVRLSRSLISMLRSHSCASWHASSCTSMQA